MLNILSNSLKLYKQNPDEELLNSCIELALRLETVIMSAEKLTTNLAKSSNQSTEIPPGKGSFRWLFMEVPYATKATNDTSMPDNDDPRRA